MRALALARSSRESAAICASPMRPTSGIRRSNASMTSCSARSSSDVVVIGQHATHVTTMQVQSTESRCGLHSPAPGHVATPV